MELIKPGINLNFVGMRYKAFLASVVVLLIGLAAFYLKGLNMGVDFAGGTLLQVKFSQPTNPDAIREALKEEAANSTIQQVGSKENNEYLIRTDAMPSELQALSQKFDRDLAKAFGEGKATVLRVEMVGPKVGEDLRQKALKAMYYALLFIAIYISGRFEFKWVTSAVMGGVLMVGIYFMEALQTNITYLVVAALCVTLVLCWILKLPYALGALVSLVHDILITIGIFIIFDKEFTIEVFAALLTLAGYSLNDTIIVYDRIRENRNKDRKQKFDVMVNDAINQTLSRTLLTSTCVLFVLLCLFFLGGAVIHDFTFAMLIGIITGTYSSVFVASPILIIYEDLTKKGLKPKRA